MQNVVERARGPVLVSILNYRLPELTRQTLKSLFASCLQQRSLITAVVDNGSGDRSVDRIARKFPQVPIIQSARNLGFAGGNNLALRYLFERVPARVDRADTFVLLLNNDVEVEPDSIQICIDLMVNEGDVGIVGPRVLLPDGRLDLACRRSFPTPVSGFWKLTGLARRFPDDPRIARYNLTHLSEFQRADVDAVMGAFMLLRLSAIDSAGLLDDDFFMYGEDLDWAYRIKAHGWRVVYYPEAQVMHWKGASTRRQPYRMIVEFYRAMWLFYRKHYASGKPSLLNWLIMFGISGRAALSLLANVLRTSESRRVG